MQSFAKETPSSPFSQDCIMMFCTEMLKFVAEGTVTNTKP